MNNQMCAVCRENPADPIKSRIKRISDILRRVEPTRDNRQSFNWDLNVKCKYGLKCFDAEKTISSIKRTINEIDAKLVTVATDPEEERTYHQVLQLLRGQFPSVYNQLERLHRK